MIDGRTLATHLARGMTLLLGAVFVAAVVILCAVTWLALLVSATIG